MTRNLMWFAAGAIAVPAVVGLGGLMFLKTGAHGFSARSDPSFMETFAAQQARNLALPPDARNRANPVTKSKEVLDEAMAHWADHCAVCHGNDGSGQVDIISSLFSRRRHVWPRLTCITSTRIWIGTAEELWRASFPILTSSATRSAASSTFATISPSLIPKVASQISDANPSSSVPFDSRLEAASSGRELCGSGRVDG